MARPASAPRARKWPWPRWVVVMACCGSSAPAPPTAPAPPGVEPPAPGILVDGVAPTLTSSLPADNAAAVALDANLVLTFSENVKVGTGNIVIKKVSDQSVSEVETMAGGAAQVTLDGKVVTINPKADLTAGTAYYVERADTAFTLMAGNA